MSTRPSDGYREHAYELPSYQLALHWWRLARLRADAPRVQKIRQAMKETDK